MAYKLKQRVKNWRRHNASTYSHGVRKWQQCKKLYNWVSNWFVKDRIRFI